MSVYGFDDSKNKHIFKIQNTNLGNQTFRPEISEVQEATSGEIKLDFDNSTAAAISNGTMANTFIMLGYKTSQLVFKTYINLAPITKSGSGGTSGDLLYRSYNDIILSNNTIFNFDIRIIKESNQYKLKIEYATDGATSDDIQLNIGVSIYTQEIV